MNKIIATLRAIFQFPMYFLKFGPINSVLMFKKVCGYIWVKPPK